jgi:hypothetical protein
MIHSTPFAERMRRAFTLTPRGVVGLVDDLLGLQAGNQCQSRLRSNCSATNRSETASCWPTCHPATFNPIHPPNRQRHAPRPNSAAPAPRIVRQSVRQTYPSER